MWEDAQAPSILAYIRGNKHLDIPERLEGHFDARNQFMMAPAFFRAVALQKHFALCNLIAVLTSGLESQVSARGKPVKKRRPVENP